MRFFLLGLCLAGFANAWATGPDLEKTVYLNGQAWSPEVRSRVYFTAQGSKIMPYDWAMALMAKDRATPFFSSQNLKRYGYLPQAAAPLNKDGLPIGFTKDEQPGGFTKNAAAQNQIPVSDQMPQLGITCAACHTSELSYRGFKLRIDGGPSYSNFQMFTKDMDEALNRVAFDLDNAFLPFAERVYQRSLGRTLADLGETARQTFLADLKHQVQMFNETRQRWQHYNGIESAKTVYGPGRNDAFGVIFNQTLVEFLNRPDNAHAPNAPVKYPVIWDAPAHDVVQWVGIARNSAAAGGPIARNIGQVLGVFGHTDVYSPTYTRGYCTSAKRQSLNDLEDGVRSLRSPTWPKDLFGFDSERAKRGQKLYQNQCAQCHRLNERTIPEALAHMQALGIKNFAVYKLPTQPERKANEVMVPIEGTTDSSSMALSPVGTDPLTAKNAYSFSAKTGPLEGRKLRVLSGRLLEAEEPRATILRHIVAGSILGSFSDITCANTPTDLNADVGLAKVIMDKLLGFTTEDTDPPNLAARQAAFKDALSKYKARPLNGIWAAPPYLHNGSVRSLKQLLLKPDQRETSFAFTCNEFDPVEVGLNCTPEQVNDSNRLWDPSFVFVARNSGGEAIPGNSNQGHDFGTDLSDEQKLDLIEYIKAL